MAKIDFIPTKAPDLNTLESQFLEHIDEAATTLGIPANFVTAAKLLIAAHQAAFNEKNAADVAYRAAVEKVKKAEWNAVNGKGGIIELTKLIKSIPGYSEDIGEMLGIEGSELVLALANVKPVLTANYEGLNVVLRFKKQGTQGIKIFSRRGDETEFSFLAIDTESPYIDSRPKLDSMRPEKREYQAIYVYKDEPVGNMSDIVRYTIQ